MNEHHVTCEIQARYFVDEPDCDSIKATWMLLHGYGQLARDLRVCFAPCLNPGIRCIYPEGLSNFYSSLRKSRVGASWMTRENRQVAINNALQYLKTVVDNSVKPDLILGFSQGAEMASRLSLLLESKTLVLWGGRLAPEVFEPEMLEKMRTKKVIKVQASDDVIYTMEQHEKDCEQYDSYGITYEVMPFQGAHEVPELQVERLIKKITPHS